jgi:glucosyl-dolichyl phosphate glucuronosyltransferase
VADSGPVLSVIITSYAKNRLPGVFNLLESLKAQTYEHIEIVFVGEREPELCEQVKDYADQQGMRSVIVLFNDGQPGLSAARNRGIEHASGDIVGFVDDDVMLFPEWAEAMVEGYEDGSVIGVTGPALPLWEDSRMGWFPEELYWIISCTGWTGWNEAREARSAWGHGMSFKREAFHEAGLFDTATGSQGGYSPNIAEDLEFSLRAKRRTGKRIVFNPRARLWHKVPKSRLGLRFIIGRARHIGVSRYQLKKLYPDDQELFDLEVGQLGRILKMLLKVPGEFLSNPKNACRKFLVTFVVLASAAWGYAVAFVRLDILKRGRRVWSSGHRN